LGDRFGRIAFERRITLPRPRSRSDPALVALYDEIWSALQARTAERAA